MSIRYSRRRVRIGLPTANAAPHLGRRRAFPATGATFTEVAEFK
jgi:hypothetical protein